MMRDMVLADLERVLAIELRVQRHHTDKAPADAGA